LNPEAHPGLAAPSGEAGPVVRDLGLLVHPPPDPVTNVLADDSVAAGDRDVLDRGADVADRVAGPGSGDPGHHRETGRLDERPDRFGRVTPDEERACRIAVPALDDRPGVDRHELAGLDRAIAGDPVDDLVVE